MRHHAQLADDAIELGDQVGQRRRSSRSRLSMPVMVCSEAGTQRPARAFAANLFLVADCALAGAAKPRWLTDRGEPGSASAPRPVHACDRAEPR